VRAPGEQTDHEQERQDRDEHGGEQRGIEDQGHDRQGEADEDGRKHEARDVGEHPLHALGVLHCE
jgi:hypothetical protein